MSKTWIVVAEKSRARVFETDSGNRQLREIHAFAHPQTRLHEQALTSDLPGRSFDSAGQGRHALETPVPPKQQEALQFAKELCSYIASGRKNNRFKHLGLVAAPSMLGLLREKLDTESSKRICFEIDKNLVQLSAEEIRQHLPEHLPH